MCAALIGRAREREAIEDALAELPAGTGAVVTIAGEPGIGKSRLLAHLAARAAAAGFLVREARASEFEPTSRTRSGARRSTTTRTTRPRTGTVATGRCANS